MVQPVDPIKPGPGQESVWDYPRPPRLETTEKLLKVVFNERVIAETTRGFRVLETSHPPVYYFPPEDIEMQLLHSARIESWCEWKGKAGYYDLVVGEEVARRCAWYYPDPTEGFKTIKDYVAFYAWAMQACYVGGELVSPQPGGMYGGWITKDIVGPFKGIPGSAGW